MPASCPGKFRPMITWLTRFALAALALPFAFCNANASIDVDVELVIAVDVSASIGWDEYRFQRRGYVEAIRHPDFARAVSALRHQRIALTYVEWSSSKLQTIIVPWREIDDAASAGAFAAALEAAPFIRGQGTSISGAIDFGAGILLSNSFEGDRKVIDISGDSPNLSGSPVALARDSAVAREIVINGLPITINPSMKPVDLAEYYSECVIGGPGSFMLPVKRMEEFAEAVRQKLIREVAGLPEETIVPISVSPPVDCLAGEKALARIWGRGPYARLGARESTRDYLERWYRLRREIERNRHRKLDRWY